MQPAAAPAVVPVRATRSSFASSIRLGAAARRHAGGAARRHRRPGDAALPRRRHRRRAGRDEPARRPPPEAAGPARRGRRSRRSASWRPPSRRCRCSICLPSTTIAAGLAAGYLGTTLTGGTAAAVLLVGRVLRARRRRRPRPTARPPRSGCSSRWSAACSPRASTACRRCRPPMDRYAEARRLLAAAARRHARPRRQPRPGHRRADAHGRLHRHRPARARRRAAARRRRPARPARAARLPARPVAGRPRGGRARSPAPGCRARRVVDRRLPDTGGGGVRAGSTLLVLPIVVGDSRVGVVALEWRAADG